MGEKEHLKIMCAGCDCMSSTTPGLHVSRHKEASRMQSSNKNNDNIKIIFRRIRMNSGNSLPNFPKLSMACWSITCNSCLAQSLCTSWWNLQGLILMSRSQAQWKALEWQMSSSPAHSSLADYNSACISASSTTSSEGCRTKSTFHASAIKSTKPTKSTKPASSTTFTNADTFDTRQCSCKTQASSVR